MRPRRRAADAPPPAPETLHETALRMLGRRALSRAEISGRLLDRGYAEAAVRVELIRLERAGLIDEAALARAVCQAQQRAGRGRRAAVAALRRRLVASDAAAAALDEVADAGGEGGALALALERATAKHRFWRRLPEERRKVIRYLLARGFGLDEARRALDEKRRDDPNGEQIDDAGDPPGLP